jgi:glycosyltransferase involved in cell wall biosynthesis
VTGTGGGPDLGGVRIAVFNWRDPGHPQAGGAERYAWEIARGLAARGAAVWFITARAPGQARRDRRDGVQFRRAGGRFTVYPRALGWLLAHRGSVDAVLDCQNGIPFFTPLALPGRVPVLCVVHHVHSVQWTVHFPAWAARAGRLLEGPVARRVYRRQALVAVSPSTAAALRGQLGWPGDIYLVPNGAPQPAAAIPSRPAFPPAFPPASPAASPLGPPAASPPACPSGSPLGSPAASPRGAPAASPPACPADPTAGPPLSLAWVGRLVSHKRAALILPVAERLRGRGCTIDVVGRGPGAGPLAAAVTARGLAGVVRLRGFLPEAEKERVLAGSVLHLNTSLGEGWGLCVLEAAALGVPTVAFAVDGLRDAVRDGETGWLVRDDEQIEDVAERAVKELADPARRAEIAAACRAWAARFTWEASTARMAALLAAAIRAGTARGLGEPGAGWPP